MKIGILGVPVSSGNRGVLALGASLLNLCSEAADDPEMWLFAANKDKTPATFRINGRPRQIPVVNARLAPRSRWRDHLV